MYTKLIQQHLDHLSPPAGSPEESHPCGSGGDAAVPQERYLLLPHGQGELPGPSAGHREHTRVHRCREAEDQRRQSNAKVRSLFVVTHGVYLLLTPRLHAKMSKTMSTILVRAKLHCFQLIGWRH